MEFLATRWRRSRVLAAALSGLAACGGGGGGGSQSAGGPTTPSAPTVPSPLVPPAYNISGHWEGRESSTTGSGTVAWDLTQDQNNVTGSGSVTEDKTRGGILAAVLSGRTLTFNFNFGSNCQRSVSGTTTVGPTSMTGTFSGQDCRGAQISNGSLSMSIMRPDLLGTWSGQFRPELMGGNGQWIWQVVGEDGSNLTGSVTVPSGSRPGEIGVLDATIFYAVGNPGLAYTVTFDGGCPGTISGKASVTDTEIASNGMNTFAADTCLGHFVNEVSVLTKQ